MASLDQIAAALEAAHRSGNEEHARILAQAYRDAQQAQQDPTANMGGFERFLEGAAVGVSDLIRGGKQLLNIGDQDTLRTEIAAARELDKSYLDNTAGMAGNIVSKVAASVPTMFIPGAGTIAGGTAIGAGLGLLEPSINERETIRNVLGGGAGGGLGVAAGRLIPAAYNAIVRPFFKGGQRHIVGNTLREAIDNNVDEFLPKLTNPDTYVPGSIPTMAETTMLPKVAKLQKAARNLPDGGLLVEREIGNNAARLQAIRGIAKDDATLEALKQARDETAKVLYRQAGKQQLPVEKELAELLSASPIRSAAKAAGIHKYKLQPHSEVNLLTLTRHQNNISVDDLHKIKLALDDAANFTPGSSFEAMQQGGIIKSKQGLLNYLDKNSQDYLLARKTFEEQSKPINQIEIGQALKNKLTPALTENGIPSRERANMFAEAIRNQDATIKKATGFGGNKSLEDIMNPDQMATINGILKDLERKANAGDLAGARGSDTAQNLIADNFLRSLLGPVGMPRSWLNRAVSGSIMNALPRRAVDLVAPSIERNVQGLLVEAMSDPRLAAELIRSTQTPGNIWLHRSYKAMPALGAQGLLNAN